MTLRDHTFLGLTQSLCPECLALVPAKIVVRDKRVYFRKHCTTHGIREDYICSDVSAFDRMEYSVPGRFPEHFGTEPDKGCPYDCGLCTEHEQHTCVGLIEITSACNLDCPMCFASSGSSGRHLSFDECQRSIDRLVEVEGRPEVLQLSGGEPTIHPEFASIFNYACAQPIDVVMINTNGLRLAHDPAMIATLAAQRHRCEVYLQFDGFREATSRALRGESLVDTKLRAIEILGRHGIRTTLVSTLQAETNLDEVGAIVRFGVERPWITGISFQPATYSGRYVLPEVLERRVTFPDVVEAIAEQTEGLFRVDDFLPLPCAHPNCHSLAYAYRTNGRVVPLTRFIDAAENLDLLANGITFTRPMARQLIENYLGKLGCCAGGDCCGGEKPETTVVSLGDATSGVLNLNELRVVELGAGVGRSIGGGIEDVANDFFRRALAEDLAPEDVFRITITSFLDAFNFDVRRLMKCCIHHVLPSGHVIPFCAYNVLYRPGHVPLAPLVEALSRPAQGGGSTRSVRSAPLAAGR